jgi:sugar phosphate isomerase/epimerase
MNPIIMHVNYCEQGQTIEEICYKAVEWGFDGVEFRRKRNGIEENVEGYLDVIAKAVNKSGLKEIIFGSPGPNLMVKDEKTRQQELEAALDFYRLASERFKLSVCNTFTGPLINEDQNIASSDYDKHGSYAATEEQWKWAVGGFKTLGKLAEERGFKFAFETHMNYIHDLPSAAKKLVDRIENPAVGINLDYGNAVYFNSSPTIKEAITTVKSNLFYVHLKNSIGLMNNRIPTGLGEGEINHREYLRLLKEVGYTGPICIEAPRSGDREWYAQQDIAYINDLLRDLNWK